MVDVIGLMVVVVALLVLGAVAFLRRSQDGAGSNRVPIVVGSVLLVLLLVFGVVGGRDSGGGDGAEDPLPPAAAFFVSPLDDASVTSPVEVTMDADRATIEPAGAVRARAGHLHVSVDVDCVAAGKVIPLDASHIHLGDGGRSTSIPLSPGPHRLCVQLGDGAHRAFGEPDDVSFVVQ